MSNSRWDTLQQLFEELLPKPADERRVRLDAIGRDDPAMREELEALLRAADAPSNPLDAAPLAADALAASGSSSPFQPGSVVGPYSLIRLVGEGGMGWVWLAERTDGTLKRMVALKLPKWTWALPDITTRLARERDILASLEHAHIARLYDAGVDALGRPYLAMEYVEGQPIDVYCRERRLSLDDRLRLVLQVAHAVAYAHSQLVVHRDLKPSNIVVAADGSVRLLDFGIAKLLDTEATTGPEVTAAGTRVFTLRYAAPEQVAGGQIGTPTDVYSLGLVLFELLTEASPYRLPRGGAAALEEAILAGDTRLASAAAENPTLGRRLKGDLDAVLNKALKARPAERYASIDAFADDLERYLKHETVSAQPDSAAYRIRTFARRHRTGLAAAAMVGLTLAGATVYSARQAAIAAREANKATAIKDFLLETFQRASANASRNGDPKNLRAIELVDEGHARLTTSLANAPDVQLELIPVLANIYEGLDATDKASAVFETGLPIAETQGPGNPHTPFFLTGIANALSFRGDFDAAERAISSAEAAFEATGDHESRAYARLLKIKGSIVRRRGPEGQQQAVTLLQRASDLFRTHYPTDQDHEGAFMYLAQTFMQLERTPDAIVAADATVRASELLPPEDLMNRASAYSLRASILDRVGEAERAQGDYERASTAYRSSVGVEHFLYLQNENLRALTLQILGRRDEALSVLEASAAAISRVRPRTNTEMNTLHRVSVAYERDGQPAKALDAATRGLVLVRANTPGSSPALMGGLLLDEARARLLMGEHGRAAALAQEAIDSSRASKALSATAEADAALVLGSAALAAGDATSARDHATRVVALSTGDAFAARVRAARARLLLSRATASPSEATTHATSALTQLDALPPPGDPFLRAGVLDRLGALYCTAAQRDQGRRALEEALALRRPRQDPGSDAVSQTARVLSACAS